MPNAFHTATCLPFGSPLYVMLKPVGARCNLSCDYCYYLSKLPAMQFPTLSEALLEDFTRQYLEAQTTPQVLFTWHGGEPLLRPMSFYEKALGLQRRYARGRQVDNCLQTNGTLLTDEWCRFLRDNHFLVGISIDGPQWMHDHYRHSVVGHASKHDNAGRQSWHRVMRGIELLEKHGVEWNAMATVNNVTAQAPQEFYHFFRDLGCQFLQFTPVVETLPASVSVRPSASVSGSDTPCSSAPVSVPPSASVSGSHTPCSSVPARGADVTVAPYSVSADAWGRFLCAVYDEWVRRDVGEIFVQTFDATLANWVGEPPGVCSLSAMCGHAAVMETDGTVYSCDHFVFPEYRLGNIRQQPLTALVYGEQQRRFGRQKHDGLTDQCRQCQWLFACHGECPRNRFARDCYGNPGHNYLCAGYRQFFAHVAADMDFMAAELQAGRPPANIMSVK